jgi:V8-like Glu-specific endopeptidase
MQEHPTFPIGSDPRQLLAPSLAIAQIQCDFEIGRVIGTGWFISPRVLITAGHVLARSAADQAINVVIKPGYSGAEPPALGTFSAVKFDFAPGWDFTVGTPLDYAAIEIDTDQTSFFSFTVLSDAQLTSQTFEIAGYPIGFGTQLGALYGATGTVTIPTPDMTAYQNMLLYNISTSGGQSGAPLFTISGSNTVVGIHVEDGLAGAFNVGIRITAEVYSQLSNWQAGLGQVQRGPTARPLSSTASPT